MRKETLQETLAYYKNENGNLYEVDKDVYVSKSNRGYTIIKASPNISETAHSVEFVSIGNVSVIEQFEAI